MREVGSDCVLKENNKVGFAADLEENPHCQAVCDRVQQKTGLM